MSRASVPKSNVFETDGMEVNVNKNLPSHYSAEVLATEIVRLIEQQNIGSMKEALKLISLVYKEPSKVIEVYDLACLVVRRRITDKNQSPAIHINPEADNEVLLASIALAGGNIRQAFSKLKAGVELGARLPLCRHVTFELLKSIKSKDRASELVLSEDGITSIEIGLVPKVGMAMYSISESPLAMRLWQKDRKPNPIIESIHLKDAVEIKKDLLSGEFTSVGLWKSKGLGAIDWLSYMRSLNLSVNQNQK